MAAYIARRLVWVVFLLFMITLITFVIFNVLPAGDPAVARAGRQPSPELVEAIRQQFGLDKPKPVQFVNYIGDILPFFGHNGVYFGFSYQNQADVLPAILQRLPADDLPDRRRRDPLALHRHPARRPLRRQDRLVDGPRWRWASRCCSSRPRCTSSAWSRCSCSTTRSGSARYCRATRPTARRTAFFGHAETLIMPWCVLAAAFAAIYARFLRGNLIDTLQEDYIRTARAKGLSERRVIFRHGVRAAITPIVTLLGLDIGILLGGAILTETVFNIPGIGRYAYNAINLSDLPVIQGTVLFGAFFIVTMSLIVDILYAFIDPRVRY